MRAGRSIAKYGPPEHVGPPVVERACEPMSLAAVGRAMNLSRERVRQLEVSALAKCRSVLEAHGLGIDDLLDPTGGGFGVSRRRIHRSD
ncbi:sigma factor-like helix-turn-helix DNA-binding protein [Variovorax rhizosphaerae]|uniref:Sigma factor-like helix-turn-helix DNA-binding protein n=1 Tax=Variovorax rhizosphaerae TaxID=1836200 RepID=A0ABU8WSE9_9BURK